MRKHTKSRWWKIPVVAASAVVGTALVTVLIAQAVTVGPSAPGTAASDSSAGSYAWSNPSNITASDDSYAGATADDSGSEYLKATNFGFSVPAGATIDGIEVGVERYDSTAGAPAMSDATVKLLKAGVATGDNKADTVTDWPTSDPDTLTTYGSSSDTWGASWTASDINDTDFGLIFQADSGCDGICFGHTAVVDYLVVTVYYTAASPAAVSNSGGDSGGGEPNNPTAGITAVKLGVKQQTRYPDVARSSSAAGGASTGPQHTIAAGETFSITTKPPDADQVQHVFIRINGETYFLKDSSKDPNNPSYALTVPQLPAGTYPYTLTVDWGITTQSERGTLVVAEKLPPLSSLVSSINSIFRQVYGRDPSAEEQRQWQTRIVNGDKRTFPELFGALQWNFLHK